MERTLTFFKKDNFLNTKIGIWLCLIYFPLFLNLGGHFMLRWDESRYGASSYEMLHGSNPFVVTYNNSPSMDSPKPPLFHWISALFIAILGFNETSVRLPNAFAGFIVCIAIMYISVKKFRSFSLGAIASLILLTTPEGFCGTDHCARTGDYDAMLTMFSFLGLLYFYRYNERTDKNKYLFLTFVFFALAVLTKGVSGLFYAPGMLIYALVKGNFVALVKNKWLYISSAMFIVVVGFVLLIREYYTPGYLQALNEMELFGRHDTVKDGHVGDFWFYVSFLRERFASFFIFISFSWVLGLSCKDDRIRNFSLFSLISVFSFYIVIATAESKLQWYSLPLFPLLSLQAGILIWILLKYIADFINTRIPVNKIKLFYLALILIFLRSYAESVGNANQKVVSESYRNWNNVQEYLKYGKELMKNAILVATPNDTQGPYLFYYYKLNDRGFNLRYQLGPSNYVPGDKLIVEDPAIQEVIEKNYDIKLIDQHHHLKVYSVIGKKI